MTHSETLLESYLNTKGIQWKRVSTKQGIRTPDYLIEQNGARHWFEVKEFEDPRVKPTSGFSPCPAVVEKIKQARKQFKGLQGDCCALILHNCKSIYRSTMVPTVLSAAFGEFLQIQPNPNSLLHDEPSRFRFSGRSSLDKTRNTTICAIIVLEHYELQERLVDAWHELRRRDAKGEPLYPLALADILQNSPNLSQKISYQGSVRVRVLENPYARVPFPQDLFCGPLDQRWGHEDKSPWYTLLWSGSELLKLRTRPHKPVPLWLL